ncbi:hypothetical protein ACQR16_28900 [Bradyrhizobium oligotrophicum]
MDFGKTQQEFFSGEDWTGVFALKMLANIAFWRRPFGAFLQGIPIAA